MQLPVYRLRVIEVYKYFAYGGGLSGFKSVVLIRSMLHMQLHNVVRGSQFDRGFCY